ncbi:MAG: hypothetical protein HFF97_06790 [Oscillibacter sp.]|jgi:hypothetical protein|uniref:flagellar export chaperone FlgN n=1 Tax=uncultured Oscillibacter sp. TaxID=876091 RepID=UPI00216BD672|nr:flagellar export chaperone FlgN [uncultured Oscillibacter sp.]MCI9644416.1 hypothetical protein [Oscillibacter sp.]
MEEIYRSYLGFLNSMSRGLESLTGLNEKKLAAAQADDLTVLNELLNQEQAQALNFRGLELARDKLLAQLGLAGVPLSKVPGRFPPAMQEEARKAVETLQDRYAAYRRTAGKTRTLLEQNLHEVEGIIVQLGGPPSGGPGGPGYGKEPEGSAPPPSMKTDFRA